MNTWASIIGITIFLLFVIIFTTEIQIESKAQSSTSQQPSGIYHFIKGWGLNGTGDGQVLDYIKDLDTDSKGNVFIIDNHPHRIQKFDNNGTFLTKWEFKTGDDSSDLTNLFIDSSDSVFVMDFDDHLYELDKNGEVKTEWTVNGTGDEPFVSSSDLVVDSFGYVYIADDSSKRIHKFDSNGKFITKWGSPGSGDGQFDGPYRISIDLQDNIYVIDDNNYRIQKFDSNGKFITKWGCEGEGEGQFMDLQDIDIGNNNKIYVMDTVPDRFQVFDSNGKFITKWYDGVEGERSFSDFEKITVDHLSNVIITGMEGIPSDSYSGNKILKFSNNDNFVPTPLIPNPDYVNNTRSSC